MLSAENFTQIAKLHQAKFVAEDILKKFFFFFFSEKISLITSCELSALHDMLRLISSKKNKVKIKMASAAAVIGPLRVKEYQ